MWRSHSKGKEGPKRLFNLPVVPQVPEAQTEARSPDSWPKSNLVLCLQRKLLGSCTLSEKDHHISIPSLDISQKGLRSKRTQHSDPEVVESLPRPGSQRNEGRHGEQQESALVV